MNLQVLIRNRGVRLLQATFKEWMEDNAPRLSAALAYYSIFSIAPLLVIAIGIAGLVLEEEAVRGQLEQQLKGYVGPEAASGLQSMVQSASRPTESSLAAVFGFAMLLLGASGVFGQLKDALNTIWEVKPRPGGGVIRFVRERLLSFGMVLVIGFLLLTSLLLTTAVAALSDYLENVFKLPEMVWGVITFLISFGVVTTLFALIFKMLPDAEVEWRSAWIGALVTAVLFEIGKFFLSYYLGREGATSSYGAAGSIVLLLLWVYYTSCILFFGAEFTQVYARETGHVIRPAEGAEPVTAETPAQEGLAAATKEVASQTVTVPEPFLIEVPARQPAEPHPLGALFAVTAVSFVVGLVAGRPAEKADKPIANIRRGVAGLGGEANAALAEMMGAVRRGREHRRH
jgi:membrane protein